MVIKRCECFIRETCTLVNIIIRIVLLESFEAIFRKMAEYDMRRQLEILSSEKRELIKVNHRWDDQYKQLESMYRRLQDDNLRMQRELEATIYNLKAQVYELEQNGRVTSSLNPSQEKCNLPHFDNSNTELLQLREANKKLHIENDRLSNELTMLKHKLSEMQAVNTTVQQYKNQIDLLNQQVSTYKEDFDKERADRERLSSEKNAMQLKHDNEISILHIRLDKLQKELNYYTSTNVKLQQQLKLRTSKDSDSYQNYLSTKGYNDAYTPPPMDPFVEKDEEEEDIVIKCESMPTTNNGLMVNGDHTQPRSLQNIGVIARDPGNVKPKSSPPEQKAHSNGPRFHIPLFSKETKYKCSRCNRKFTDKNEHADHTTKCIQ